MSFCHVCQHNGRTSSRIPDYILDKCHQRHINGRRTCFACQSLVDIDRKIEVARRTLQTLLDEKERLVSVLNEEHDPFANRIPVEIASRVFELCRPIVPAAYTSDVRYVEKDLIRAVFTPGRICNNWRRIAESTLDLWNVLCTTITKSNCIPSISIIDHWLSRSASLPLFIQFGVEDTSGKVFDHVVRRVLKLLVDHALRWEVLDLDVPSDFLPLMSVGLANKSLDHLDHIKLELYVEGGEVLLLNAVPRRLTLRTACWDAISMNCLGWESLTHIVAAIIYTDEAIQLFRHAPHLSFCNIGELIDGDSSLSISPVKCASLHTLMIQSAPNNFWDHCILPSLETLQIEHFGHDPQAECWTCLQGLIHRSSCKIKTLTIGDYQLCQCQAQVTEVLQLTPELIHLSLYGTVLLNPFFSTLNAAATTALEEPNVHFLKQLKSLGCASLNLNFDWSELIGFLSIMTSRQQQSLQSFTFQHKSGDPEKAYGATLDKDMFKHLMDAVHRLDFKLVDHGDRDMVEWLSQRCL